MNYLQMIQHTPLRKSPYNHTMKGILDSSRDYPATVGRSQHSTSVFLAENFEMPHVDSSLNKRQPPTKQMVRFGVFPAKMMFIQYL